MSNWYLQNGKDSDVVISSRVRLARNLVEYNFPNKHLKDESKEVLNKLEEITPSLGYGHKNKFNGKTHNKPRFCDE